jgi:hypothetical protein
MFSHRSPRVSSLEQQHRGNTRCIGETNAFESNSSDSAKQSSSRRAPRAVQLGLGLIVDRRHDRARFLYRIDA